jgi:nitrous oxide reductase accessory protein NosL
MRLHPILAVVCLFVAGCGSSDDTSPPSPADRRVNDLSKKAGGNWDALAPEEKQELIQQLGKGDERTARVSFEARGSAGGPPMPR